MRARSLDQSQRDRALQGILVLEFFERLQSRGTV